VACTSILDVRYQHLASAPPLESGTRVRLLLHTAETLAVADPLDPPDAPVLPGTTRWLQLRLSQPVAMLPGDRFVLRRESPMTTLGGGEVVDPWAPRIRRKDALQAVELLEQMAAGDDLARIERKGPAGLSVAEAQARMGEIPPGAVCFGDTLFSEHRAEQMATSLEQGLADWHAAHPLGTGAPRRTLHRGSLAGLDARAFEALVDRVSQEGRVVLDGPRVALAGHRVELSDADQAAIDALMKRLAEAGLAPPATPELLEGCGITEDHLALLLGRGTVERIEGRLVRGDHLAELVVSVRSFLAENGTLSTGDFKALTGLTRRHAIPLLEWLDARGITTRSGDVRVPGSG
jgi:selenocysteine-specific elongation factor